MRRLDVHILADFLAPFLFDNAANLCSYKLSTVSKSSSIVSAPQMTGILDENQLGKKREKNVSDKLELQSYSIRSNGNRIGK